MAATSIGQRFARFDAAEYRLCLQLNRGCDVMAIRGVFAVASRLGDGLFWYLLILLLPLLYAARGVAFDPGHPSLPGAWLGAVAIHGPGGRFTPGTWPALPDRRRGRRAAWGRAGGRHPVAVVVSCCAKTTS
jgi:hypothetical protein